MLIGAHRMHLHLKCIMTYLSSNINSLTKSEATYFQRSMNLTYRLPIFYGLPKVHKTPVLLRPVVSSINSFSSIFSNWLDFCMKELLPLVKSFTKNSFEVIQDLKQLTIPRNALLFSVDTKSMYTNIDTNTGISYISSFIKANQADISPNFPTNLFLEVLQLVMENNIFKFGNTTWLQLSGTAMGTPCPCAYATITFGHYENCYLLPAFTQHILYYRRYIDDIFGIWIPPDTQQEATWNDFEKQLNNWGNLEWAINKPSTKTTFLDLNIILHQTKIHTSTFQKSLNLYLYIPPSSAHPPSCLKGLIYGELRRYWLQKRPEQFSSIVTKFIGHLLDRGHLLQDLLPIIRNAAMKLDNHNSQPSNTTGSDSTLFIHWTYHPQGLQRQDIRDAYSSTLQDTLDYDRMTVAVTRPKNLRGVLSTAALKPYTGMDIQRLITESHTQHTTR